MLTTDFAACSAELFSAEKNGIEYFIFQDEFCPEACSFAEKIQMAMSDRMSMIHTYVESDSDYKDAFGKMSGEQKAKLFLHPQVYIFADGGVITWLGSKCISDKMVSVTFDGVLDNMGNVEIFSEE